MARRPALAADVRKIIWRRYYGQKDSGLCIVCQESSISVDQRYGFEAGHIVAYRWCRSNESIYLIPMCSTCNSDGRDLCLLDYLWCRERYDAVKLIGWRTYCALREINRDEVITRYNDECWRVVVTIFGNKVFLAGALQNINGVAELLREKQLRHLRKKQLCLLNKLEAIQLRSKALLVERRLDLN